MPAKNPMDESLLREMVDQDIPNYQIAIHFHCSESCIERRMSKLGLKKQRTGPKNGARHPKWKGGRILLGGYWYIYAPDHPNCTQAKYVAEHRLVMEQKLGRYLSRKEVVHHVDGNPLNNDPENLMIFGSNGDHLRHELTGKCPNWTPEGFARMPETIRRKHNHRY